MLQITPRLFYKVGIGCFIVIVLCNGFNLMHGWAASNWYVRVAAMAGLIFNLALCGLFYYLLENTPQTESGALSTTSVDEIASAFDEAQSAPKKPIIVPRHHKPKSK